MANKYAQFDGSTGYITVPTDAALNLGTGDFTICFWAKFTNNLKLSVCSKYNGVSSVPRWHINTNTGALVFFAYDNDEDHNPINSGNINIDSYLNGWAFVCFVIDRDSHIKTYIKNSLINTVVLGVNDSPLTLDNSLDFLIGKNSFSGSLDDLRIYKAALTATDVGIIYNLGRGDKYAAGQLAAGSNVEPSFVMEFDADFVADEIFTTVPSSPSLVGTRSVGVTILDGGVPFPQNDTFAALFNFWEW